MRKLWSMTKSYRYGDVANIQAILPQRPLMYQDFAAMTSTSVCRLCRVKHSCYLILTIWEDPINDLNAFRKLAQSSLQAQVPRHDFSTIDN